jgi:integrase
MKADKTFPRIMAHSLRHTTPAWRLLQALTSRVVQRQLCHKSAALTLDTYADLFDDDIDSVAAALDRSVPEMCHFRPQSGA